MSHRYRVVKLYNNSIEFNSEYTEIFILVKNKK